MRETTASLTPVLRRYAHALLGRWPLAGARADARSRADQDADDLAHEVLLSFWRAGLLRREAGAQPSGSLRLALLRCLTALAREFSRRQLDFAVCENFGACENIEAQGGSRRGARPRRRRVRHDRRYRRGSS